MGRHRCPFPLTVKFGDLYEKLLVWDFGFPSQNGKMATFNRWNIQVCDFGQYCVDGVEWAIVARGTEMAVWDGCQMDYGGREICAATVIVARGGRRKGH